MQSTVRPRKLRALEVNKQIIKSPRVCDGVLRETCITHQGVFNRTLMFLVMVFTVH